MTSVNVHHPQKKLKRNSAGTFEKMGLHFNVLRGIKTMGYRLPTPIQRKCIPSILDGHDIIAMARTGSGKSAAFLIPLINNLKQHSVKIGCRGLILSPTRDLALQTAKFAKSISKYTDLRICIIIGGESIEEQFNALSYNPDIIIGTLGRINYLLKEIPTFNLSKIKYLIFDEADKLFEMGFAIQLRGIMNSMHTNNSSHKPQTMLFSATIPKIIQQFTRANLINPVIIRLDTDIKISKNLKLDFFYSRDDDKLAVLLYVLYSMMDIENQLILIFAATRYDVELIYNFLLFHEINNVCMCYGSMEQKYRNTNINKFRKKEYNIMVVTDLASRGIDIPLLDYVINYQFTTNVKSFIHRVGRVARNGKLGHAINIIKYYELAYMCDVNQYINYNNSDIHHNNQDNFGIIPENILFPYIERVNDTFKKSSELNKQLNTCIKAMDMYNRTKTKPTKHGVIQSKKVNIKLIHPMFVSQMNEKDMQKYKMLNEIATFKARGTVFEIGGASNPNYDMMQNERKRFNNKKKNVKECESAKNKHVMRMSEAIKNKYRNSEYFIENQRINDTFENINENNGNELKQFIMELDEDELSTINKKRKLYKYNAKKNKYVTEYMGDRINRFMKQKNESCNNIENKTLYGKLYKQWQLKSKREIALNGSYEKQSVGTDKIGLMGLKKYRHIKGSNEYYEQLRAKKRINAMRNDNVLKEKSKKDKIKKFKRERFKKWWTKNRERVKIRKGKRKMRGY